MRPARGAWVTVGLTPGGQLLYNMDAPREGRMGYSYRRNKDLIDIKQDAPREGRMGYSSKVGECRNSGERCAPRGAHGLQSPAGQRQGQEVIDAPREGRMG